MDYFDMFQNALAAIGGFAILKGAYNKSKKHVRPKLENNIIGRINLRGPIMTDYPVMSMKKKGIITPSGVASSINAALADNVMGLIFDINSPGGAVVPSEEVSDLIKKVYEVPTVAVVRDCAASGAYWAASACHCILAKRTSIIGSISVIMSHLDISELANKYGVKQEIIKTGKYKDMGNMFKSLTDEEREILEGQLKEVHQYFVESIAQNRGLDIEHISKLADGRIYSGTQALSNKLIDSIGSQEEAVCFIENLMKRKHKIIHDYEMSDERQGLLSKLLGVNADAYDIGSKIADGFLDTLSSKQKDSWKLK